MKVIHKADSRGVSEFDWLHSSHTFSFSHYRNADRMGFGALRVLNDDIVAPGAGFPPHSHRDMEIISIPLSGTLLHHDSEDNEHAIRAGEVQIMSAGTGITHSEFNASKSEPVSFLQIWVLPKQRNIQSRYEQRAFPEEERHNRFQTVVSPEGGDQGLWINQDAWFSLVDLDAGGHVEYPLHLQDHGVYMFVIAGQAVIEGEVLDARDGIGLTGIPVIRLDTPGGARILAIEIPMQVKDATDA